MDYTSKVLVLAIVTTVVAPAALLIQPAPPVPPSASLSRILLHIVDKVVFYSICGFSPFAASNSDTTCLPRSPSPRGSEYEVTRTFRFSHPHLMFWFAGGGIYSAQHVALPSYRESRNTQNKLIGYATYCFLCQGTLWVRFG